MMVKVFGRSIYEAILFGVILTTIQGTSESGTCFYNIHAGSGSIRSPNYPNPYPRNIDCTWDIFAPRGYVVKLDFQDYQVQNCPDYVTLYDGDPNNPYHFGVFIGKYCFKPTYAVTSSSSSIRVKFHAGPSNLYYRGFKINYSAIPNWRNRGEHSHPSEASLQNSLESNGTNEDHPIQFFVPEIEEDASTSREHLDDLIEAHISIFVGNDKDFTRSWKIKVPRNYSLYQALENITSSDPDYKFRYQISNGKPYVDRVSDFQYNASDDAFWYVYTKPLSSNADPVFVNESPVDIKLNENEEVILWYKS